MSKTDFIRAMIEADNASGKYGGKVQTRFPPEPNGYLHIGHAKSIVLNFGLAEEYGGQCNLRFDDTNPSKEEQEYVDAIQRDVRWLGFEWAELRFASDYFDQLYAWAEALVEQGLAYVDSHSLEEIRAFRGTVTEPGRPSPYRDRSVEENLDLLRRMKAKEFGDGEHVLRAKIDLAHPNMKMRDPPIYRIRHAHHHRQGDKWCLYPLYDFTHCLSDHIEGITHSLCTLEFENNRAIYDWLLDHLVTPPRPYQTEFAKLQLDYTVLSKRRLLELVKSGMVDGWDDPRMPTIAGMRRRGFTPDAIRHFAERVGVAKANSVVELGLLEHSVREDLDHKAPRVMAVLRPLEVIIENYPEDQAEELDANYWPENFSKDELRKVAFSRRIYIERDDFAEDPPKKWHRLAPGVEVRLRYAYFLTCTRVEKDDAGQVVRLYATYDPATKGGQAPDGRKVKGTLHWVSADHAVDATVRNYDRMWTVPNPASDPEVPFTDYFNPESKVVLEDAKVEASLATVQPMDRFQFERQGYYVVDEDSAPSRPIFNRIVALKDGWAKKAPAPAPAPAERAKAAPGPAKGKEPLSAAAEALVDGGVGEEEARVVAAHAELTAWLAALTGAGTAAATGAKWLVHELPKVSEGRALAELPFGAPALAETIALVEAGTVSSAGGRRVLAVLAASGGEPKAIVEAEGLAQVQDAGALEAAIDEILAAHPDELAKYRDGKKNLMGFFMGQLMKATRGTADPKTAGRVLREKLDG